MAEVIGKLEEEALKRKNRLRELRGKRTNEEQQHNINDEEGVAVPKPVFRNYKPETEEFQESMAMDDHAGIVEKEVGTHLKMMKTPIVIEEIDIANLAPRKPDWDLKRDVSKKLEKLERRTQKAIAELIRERLKAGQEQDILQAVNIATSVASTALHDKDNPDDQ
ncbi:coiled-coil domain-containing protein 12 [Anopheles funestus]|uniref:Coiled-coil domain-containing protein 12 n=1 Tax=Anopheles funestus TaxID=62324 RepID=A0A182RKU3_ANOFN|nr:coiled-coil domain-containing protein 12 [Anopheles funestus]